MKSLSFIALLSLLVLTGCYPAHHLGYAGYSSYGVRSYSDYPASTYYRRSTVPEYSYRYSTPHHDYGHGRHHNDWDRGYNRHNWRESHHNGAPEVHNRRHYSDRTAAWQSAPHAHRHDGRRSEGGGSRREGGFGSHHGHDGRR